MTDVLQHLFSFLSGQDVSSKIKSQAATPGTSCPPLLDVGTNHVNLVVPPGARTVNVHSCGGKKLSLPLGHSTTVELLKSQLQVLTGYPATSIDLVSGSQTLDNGFDLGQLSANANLVLVHKVYGG